MDLLSHLYPSEQQLTPKQKKLLQDSRLSELITRLDLKVQPSPEYKTNQAVSNRVKDWVTRLESEPVVTRTLPSSIPPALKPPFSLSSAVMTDLEREHGPKSTWKYPLNWLPW